MTWAIRSQPAPKRCGLARMPWCGLARTTASPAHSSTATDGRAADGGRSPMRSSASTIPGAPTVLLELFNGEGQLTRAFAARGLGASKDQRAAGLLVKAAEDAGQPLAVRIQAVRGVALARRPRRRRGDAPADRLTTGRSEPAARSDHRAGAVARSGRDRPADRSGVRAVAVGARGRAARLVEAGCRHLHRFDLRARSRPAMVGSRGARDDARRSAARSRTGAADGAVEGRRPARAARGARCAGEDWRHRRGAGVHRPPQVGRSGRARRRGARPGDAQGVQRRRRPDRSREDRAGRRAVCGADRGARRADGARRRPRPGRC